MLALVLACAAAWTPGSDVYAQATEDELVEADEVPDEASAPDASIAPRDEDSAEDGTVTDEAMLPEETEVAETPDPWRDFYPPPDPSFDWIKIVSGEWLKGEIKSLYNFKFEFESDELDTLTFDWDDVLTIRSAGPQAVRYVDLEQSDAPLIAFGNLVMIEGVAVVGTGPGATSIRRNQIISIAKGTQKERDFWSGEITIGANVRSGNSDLADAAIFLMAQRRKAENRFYADYRANFSEAEGVETSNNHRINTYFDSFKTRRWYWRIIFAEYFRDRFQNVNNQVTFGTGVGYDIIRTAKTEWDVSFGIGALYKEAVSVEAGEDAGNTSPAITFGTLYDVEINKWLDYYLKYTARIVDEENGQYIHNLVTTLSSDITGALDLDLTIVWDRTEKPQPVESGAVPQQDDFRFTVGISYEF
jgi:putative salt-induced outer membrane protein YdiY